MCYQVAQLAYVIDERLKETVEKAERERALKYVVVATAKDKCKATETSEKKAQASEKARVVAKKRLAEIDVKLGEVELKLAKVESLNLA